MKERQTGTTKTRPCKRDRDPGLARERLCSALVERAGRESQRTGKKDGGGRSHRQREERQNVGTRIGMRVKEVEQEEKRGSERKRQGASKREKEALEKEREG